MGALSSTSPNENTAESPPSNEFDNKISVEQVPKPRKFFKSRNSAPSTELIAQQQQMQTQQPSINVHTNSYQNQHTQLESYHHQTSNQHSQESASEDDHHPAYPTQPIQQSTTKRGKKKKEKPEKPPKPAPKPKPEKKVKVPVAKAPPKVQEPPSRPSRVVDAGTRSSGRTRAKCVNYNEDADEADFIRRTERRVAPKLLQSPSAVTTTPVHQVESPSADATAHPPIVLRISKASSPSVI